MQNTPHTENSDTECNYKLLNQKQVCCISNYKTMTLSETKSKSENEETIHINTIFLQKGKQEKEGTLDLVNSS